MNFESIHKVAFLLPDNRDIILSLFPLFHKIYRENNEIKGIVIIDLKHRFLFKTLPFELLVIDKPQLNSIIEVHRYCANEHLLFNIDIFYDFIGNNLSSFWGMTLRAKQNWGQNKKWGRFFYKGEQSKLDPFKYIASEKIIKNNLIKLDDRKYLFIYLEFVEITDRAFWTNLFQNLVGEITLYLSDTFIIDDIFLENLKKNSHLILFSSKDESYLPALISKSKGVFTNSLWLSNMSCYLNRKIFLFQKNRNPLLFNDSLISFVEINNGIPLSICYQHSFTGEKTKLKIVKDDEVSDKEIYQSLGNENDIDFTGNYDCQQLTDINDLILHIEKEF